MPDTHAAHLGCGGDAGGGGKPGLEATNPMYPCAKLKLDQLFLQWLSLPDSQTLVRRGDVAQPSSSTRAAPACTPPAR